MSQMSNQPYPPFNPGDSTDDDLRSARGDDVRTDVHAGDVVDSADADAERSHDRRDPGEPVVDLDNLHDDTVTEGEPNTTDAYVNVIDGRPETLGVPDADGGRRDAGADLGGVREDDLGAPREGDLGREVLGRGDERERGDNLGGASSFDQRR